MTDTTTPTQPEALQVSTLCSQTIVVLFDLLSKLQAIRDAYDTVAYPPGVASSAIHTIEQFDAETDRQRRAQTAVTDNSQSFTPVKKDAGVKGNPLAELVSQLSLEDQQKLIGVLKNAKT